VPPPPEYLHCGLEAPPLAAARTLAVGGKPPPVPSRT
jgi:hypothetical protein